MFSLKVLQKKALVLLSGLLLAPTSFAIAGSDLTDFFEPTQSQVPDLQQLLRSGASVMVTFKHGLIGGLSTSTSCLQGQLTCKRDHVETCVVETEQEVMPGETFRLNIVANHESGTTMLLSNAEGSTVRMQCAAFVSSLSIKENNKLEIVRKPIYDYRVLNRFSSFDVRVRYSSPQKRIRTH